MNSNFLPPKRLLVIGCDSQDARFHRRIRMFRELGFVVSWLAFERRRTATPLPADVLSERHALLGVTRDRHYLQRVVALTLGLARAYRWGRRQPGGFQLLYAINLDNLLLAIGLKCALALRAGVVYECADVQPAFLTKGVGRLLRGLEAGCLRRVKFLVTTSPGFLREYFRSILGFSGDSFLLENKVYAEVSILRRSAAIDGTKWRAGKIRVGVFGVFRCGRTLRLIEAAADRNATKLEFVLRGYPSHEIQGEFERLVQKGGAVKYLGPYQYPDDLASIYSEIHLSWGLDFSAPGGNSSWFLSNRAYEAGFYAVPQLVLAGTEAARFVAANESGWALAEPVEASVAAFFQRITLEEIRRKSEAIAAGDPKRFLAEPDLKRLGEKLAAAMPPAGTAGTPYPSGHENLNLTPQRGNN